MDFKDYYSTLGVSKTASEKEIKQAFRKLARKHHPDLNSGDKVAEAKFKEINEAYEVLGDPEKRAKYDALGENWKGGQDFTPPPGAGAPGNGWRPAETAEWQDLGGFSDFFASIFGRAPGGRAPGRAREGRGGFGIPFPGADLESEMRVSLEDLLRGGRRRFALGGRSLEVEVPLGSRDGTVLRLAGQGEKGEGGGPPGDLFLRLRLVPHPRYRVSGDDLEMDLPIAPWQAVLGDEVALDTPDGPVTLRVPAGTSSERRLRLRGRGLPRRDGGRGDLHAVTRIVVPERPTPAERAAYEALKRGSPRRAERAPGR